MELESKLAQAVEELSKGPSLRKDNPGQKLPRAPETHTLTGHRAPVNSCAFHPVFSLLATASEDTTIKIWDHESGEFERTIKGHTKSVSTVSFNPKGTLLGTFPAILV
jgi:platelet-activating factor acetylhydrolase IB subunit alpha